MASPHDQPPPNPLDYAPPAPRPRLAAIALSLICFAIGIPICAIGAAAALGGVIIFDDGRALVRGLVFIAVGGMFCVAGKRLQRPPAR